MFKNASVICASVILFEQGGALAEGLQSLFKKRMPCCLLRNPWWAIHCYYGNIQYLPPRSPPPTRKLLPWPHAWRFFKRFSAALSSCLYPVIQTHHCQKRSSGQRPPAKKKKSHFILTALARSWMRRGNVMFH